MRVMKDKNKHIDLVDSIIETSLVDEQMQVSVDFVDRVMGEVKQLSPVKPYLKYLVNIAASLALIMLMGNLMMVVKKLTTSGENQIIEEWTSAYTMENNSNWSAYYDIELLASTEKNNSHE